MYEARFSIFYNERKYFRDLSKDTNKRVKYTKLASVYFTTSTVLSLKKSVPLYSNIQKT